MLPRFVIIGAPRSGSTYLLNLLRSHPQVAIPKAEDPYFEDPIYDGDPRKHFSPIFAGIAAGTICGIKCPTYLSSAVCAKRIADDLPDVKLIVTIRDPIARAISDYYHKMRTGRLPIMPLELGMKKILSGEWNGANVRQVLELGLYGRHLEQYLAVFPAGRILILPELGSNDAEQTSRQRLAQFLGIDAGKFATVSHDDKNVGVYNLNAVWLISKINKRRYNRITSAGHLLSSRRGAAKLADLIYAAAVRVTEASTEIFMDNSRPTLSAQTVEELTNYFSEDSEKLSRIVDNQFANIPANERQAN